MMVSGTKVQPVEILLVEGNSANVLITKEAFRGVGICNSLHVGHLGTINYDADPKS
jgi:hypothetical protein